MQLRVLIVDDEPHVLRSVTKLLARSRYPLAVKTALCAKEALAILEAEGTDLLLTDISMPGMTGLTLAARAHAMCPDCTVVILTAYDSFSYAREAIYANVSGYILKTDGDESILAQCEDTIAQILSARGEAQSAPGGDRFAELIAYIDGHIGEDCTLATLGERFGYNASYLSRLFIEKTGQNLSEYISRKKLEQAIALMQDETLSLSEIAQRLGFVTRSYFNRFIKKHSGLAPMDLRRIALQQRKER